MKFLSFLKHFTEKNDSLKTLLYFFIVLHVWLLRTHFVYKILHTIVIHISTIQDAIKFIIEDHIVAKVKMLGINTFYH